MPERLVTFTTVPEEASGADRRKAPRFQYNKEAYLQRGPGRLDQVWWLAMVRDVSSTGVSLIGSRFDIGTVLAIELPCPSPETSKIIQARVMHATEQPKGGWLLGCAFMDALSEEDLKALL